MRASTSFLLVLLPALALLLPLQTALLPGEARAAEKFRITLHDLKTKEQLYEGERTEQVEGSVVTEVTVYKRMDGTPVQTVKVVFDRETLLLHSYRLEDHRSGQIEEMRLADGVVTLANRETGKEELEKETVKWGQQTAFGNSIVPLIRRNWEAVRGGQTLFMDLLVPSRLETVGFRLVKTSETTRENTPVMVVRMEPSTWLIRLLVDPLHFYLAAEAPHRLVLYEGRSSVKTDDGDTQDLLFLYPP